MKQTVCLVPEFAAYMDMDQARAQPVDISITGDNGRDAQG